MQNANWPTLQHGSLIQSMERWILYTVFHIHAFQLHCWSRSRLKLQSFTIQWWSNCSLLDADKVPFTMANKSMCRIKKNCHKHWWMLSLEQVAMKRNWMLCLRISGKFYQRRTGKLIEKRKRRRVDRVLPGLNLYRRKFLISVLNHSNQIKIELLYLIVHFSFFKNR